MFLELLLFEVVFGGPWEGVDRPLLMTPEFPGTCLDKEEEDYYDPVIYSGKKKTQLLMT